MRVRDAMRVLEQLDPDEELRAYVYNFDLDCLVTGIEVQDGRVTIQVEALADRSDTSGEEYTVNY